MQEVQEPDYLVARVAALDIGKAEVTACVRVPGAKRGRAQQVRTWATTTRQLVQMAQAGLGVSQVVMEATSDYWKPPYYVLEAADLDPWLVNARDVKHLPGRSKTDVLDAVWLCKLAERGMLRRSFVPPPPIRELRDLTRYRADLVVARNAEKQRVEKLLEDAQIKVSVVASDIFGVSGRAMMAALIAGQRDPQVLAELSRAALRGKRPQLVEALIGRFNDHHAFLLARMLARVDVIDDDIAALDIRVEAQLQPFRDQVKQLQQVPGIGTVVAAVIIAEIGVDMTQFPTPGHLASWAQVAPRANSSAGRDKPRSTGRGNRYLRRALGEAAVSAGRTRTFLGQRYRRLARRGKKKAAVAVSRSMLHIVWHLLNDPTAQFHDLGPDYYDRYIDAERKRRHHINQLRALGYKVTLEPAA